MTTEQSELSARRRRSRLQLLQVIRERGGITRGDLSQVTGLSRSATAEGVQDLIAGHLIAERRTAPANGRGRPSGLLVPVAPEGILGAVDIGHNHISVAVTDATGRVLCESTQVVEVDEHAQISLDTAWRLLRESLTQAGVTEADLLTVAAGIPGPLDAKTGIVRSPTILSNWVNLDPARELARRVGRAVYVDNDANMGAQGELVFGSAREARDFIYVKAAHGIGTSLVLNGQTYRGSWGIAGEIGHTQLPGATSWCRCGNQGCLETVVSITEVRRQLAHIGSTAETEPDERSLATVGDDPAARRVLTAAGRTLGRVLADLCNALNPELIIAGGELGTAGAPFVQGIRESIDQYAQPAIAEAVTVRAAGLGLRSELMGAVARANEHAHTLG